MHLRVTGEFKAAKFFNLDIILEFGIDISMKKRDFLWSPKCLAIKIQSFRKIDFIRIIIIT